MNKLLRSCTFPAPEQFGHLWVLGIRKALSDALETEIGSIFKHTPLAEHLAQAKYPVHTRSYKSELEFQAK